MMSKKPVSFSEDHLEQAYSALAEAIDKAGEKHEALFLAKLTLVLANELADPATFTRAIQTALEDVSLN